MWTPKYLRYLWHSFRSPDLKDFISQGLGIEHRASRYKSWWEPHIRLSKSFQCEAIRGRKWDSVLILGSGRLFDVPIEAISSNVSSIYLADLDPGAEAVSKSLLKDARFICVDVTGSLQTWCERLRGVDSKRDLPRFLQELRTIEPELPKAELVISLNLLSQISLFWRDRFSEAVKQKFGILSNDDGSFGAELDRALQESARTLERAHMEWLNQSSARRIVLLYDQYFHFYEPNSSAWRTEEGIHVSDPIESLSNFKVTQSDSWLWHLRPSGEEGLSYGEIHEVRGLILEDSSRSAS